MARVKTWFLSLLVVACDQSIPLILNNIFCAARAGQIWSAVWKTGQMYGFEKAALIAPTLRTR